MNGMKSGASGAGLLHRRARAPSVRPALCGLCGWLLSCLVVSMAAGQSPPALAAAPQLPIPLAQLSAGWFASSLQRAGDAERQRQQLLRVLAQRGELQPRLREKMVVSAEPLDDWLDERLPMTLPGGLCLLGNRQLDRDWLRAQSKGDWRLCLVAGGGDDDVRQLRQIAPAIDYVPVRLVDVRAFLEAPAAFWTAPAAFWTVPAAVFDEEASR